MVLRYVDNSSDKWVLYHQFAVYHIQQPCVKQRSALSQDAFQNGWPPKPLSATRRGREKQIIRCGKTVKDIPTDWPAKGMNTFQGLSTEPYPSCQNQLQIHSTPDQSILPTGNLWVGHQGIGESLSSKQHAHPRSSSTKWDLKVLSNG